MSNNSNKKNSYVRKALDLGIDLSRSALSSTDKEKLLDMIGQNRDVFAKDLSELGNTNRHPHFIDTGDAHPIKQRAYRASPRARAEISRQVKEQLENDVIEPSTSDWSSPVVLVRKKNGDYRFAVDYRKLNAVTKPLNFPLPRMEDIVDTLGESNALLTCSLALGNLI